MDRDVAAANYVRTNNKIGQWCRKDLTEEVKDKMFRELLPASPLLSHTLSKFKDPNPNTNRIPVGNIST